MAATEIYTLSLHDALPIFRIVHLAVPIRPIHFWNEGQSFTASPTEAGVLIINRSEEHTSELQSHSDLVCRLLLEKKNGTSVATQRIKTGDRVRVNGYTGVV